MGPLAYSNRLEVARLVRRQGPTRILYSINGPLHIFTSVVLHEYERDKFSFATMLTSSPRAFDLLNLDASREPLSRFPLIAQRLILSWMVFENFSRLRVRLCLTKTLPN